LLKTFIEQLIDKQIKDGARIPYKKVENKK